MGKETLSWETLQDGCNVRSVKMFTGFMWASCDHAFWSFDLFVLSLLLWFSQQLTNKANATNVSDLLLSVTVLPVTAGDEGHTLSPQSRWERSHHHHHHHRHYHLGHPCLKQTGSQPLSEKKFTIKDFILNIGWIWRRILFIVTLNNHTEWNVSWMILHHGHHHPHPHPHPHLHHHHHH